MTTQIAERSLEDAIEATLLAGGPDPIAAPVIAVSEPSATYAAGLEGLPGGYHKRRPDEYDRALCLVPRDVLDFIYATQPKEWERLKQHHGTEVKERFLKRLAQEIERRGTLDVLRNGLKDSGCKFDLAFFHLRAGSTKN